MISLRRHVKHDDKASVAARTAAFAFEALRLLGDEVLSLKIHQHKISSRSFG